MLKLKCVAILGLATVIGCNGNPATVHDPLSITTSALVDGIEGVIYSQELAAEGGDGRYTWSLISGQLPDGLVLDSERGTIAGAPTMPGAFSFATKVESGDGQVAQKELSVTVHASLLVAIEALPTGIEGRAYTQELIATGGTDPYTWSIASGSLPEGLALEPEGTIAGVPTSLGSSAFELEVGSEDGQVARKALTLSVHAPLALSTTALAPATEGRAYAQELRAEGGDGTYAWNLLSGTLPSGLSLDGEGGMVEGIPDEPGGSAFVLQVVSGDGQSQEEEFAIEVSPATSLEVIVYGDGDPVPDAEVFVTLPDESFRKDTTDAEGRAHFSDLDSGLHTVTLQALPLGYSVTNPQEVEIIQGELNELVFSGAFEPADVSGTASSWGEPVVGAMVRLEGKDTVELTTDADGEFAALGLRRGEYVLSISGVTDVTFRQTEIVRTLESGSNSIDFIGRPYPEPEWTTMAAGEGHTCGTTSQGKAYCWGWNGWGQLGTGTLEDSYLPTLIDIEETFMKVVASTVHTCGLTTAGQAYCWGRNSYGLLGDGTTTDAQSPVPVAGGLSFTDIATGATHACGLTTGSDVYCWGSNRHGQLGTGPATEDASANPVPTEILSDLEFAQIAVGGGHTCGVTADGQAFCWGLNNEGQLGDGTLLNSADPVPVAGSRVFDDVFAGRGTFTCGVSPFDEAYCWGGNTFGRLGDGTSEDSATPTLVIGGLSMVVAALGNTHACGISADGATHCWGDNRNSQLGDGGSTSSSSPVAVDGSLTFSNLALGRNHTCGVRTDGRAVCWGSNYYGQFGDDSKNESAVPTEVGGAW
ncbi:MAG: putative Ig domain-containing protein [Dehalococcoidia bacterium]